MFRIEFVDAARLFDSIQEIRKYYFKMLFNGIAYTVWNFYGCLFAIAKRISLFVYFYHVEWEVKYKKKKSSRGTHST